MRDNLKYYLRVKLRRRELQHELDLIESNPDDPMAFLQSLARASTLKSNIQELDELIIQSKKFGFIWW